MPVRRGGRLVRRGVRLVRRCGRSVKRGVRLFRRGGRLVKIEHRPERLE